MANVCNGSKADIPIAIECRSLPIASTLNFPLATALTLWT
jgi:hypothetical protein